MVTPKLNKAYISERVNRESDEVNSVNKGRGASYENRAVRVGSLVSHQYAKIFEREANIGILSLN